MKTCQPKSCHDNPCVTADVKLDNGTVSCFLTEFVVVRTMTMYKKESACARAFHASYSRVSSGSGTPWQITSTGGRPSPPTSPPPSALRPLSHSNPPSSPRGSTARTNAPSVIP
ncbi:unnamed protein product, partial [Heterosigma akashiwo]